jgi:hypothetical protein
MPRLARRPRRPTPKFQLSYDPSDITRFAADYMASPYKDRTAADEDREMEEAGSRIVNGAFSSRDVQTIYRWKSARRMDLFAKNTDAQIEQAVLNAIAAKTPGEAIAALTCLSGVGVKMASAILTAMFPKLYTVSDFRASAALGVKDGNDVNFYIAYLEACRSMAEQYGITLRDFDRANWQWSKGRSKPSGAKPFCRQGTTRP